MSQIVVPFIVPATGLLKVRAQLPFARSRVLLQTVIGGPVFAFFGREFNSAAEAIAQINSTGANPDLLLPTWDLAAGVAQKSATVAFDGTDDVISLVTPTVVCVGFLAFEECEDSQAGMDRPHPHQQGRLVQR